MGSDAIEKVYDYGYVDDEDQNFYCGGMANQLVNFHRDERAGNDYGEPLGLTLHEPESDALG